MGVIKNIIVAGALISVGYGIASLGHRQESPDVRILQRDRVVYYPATPRELLKEFCVKVNQDPERHADIIDTMIDVGYELLPRAHLYTAPEGSRTHETPYNLRVIVLDDTVKTEGKDILVKRPYLENTRSGEVREIRRGELAGTLADYSCEAGNDAYAFLRRQADSVKKGVTGLVGKGKSLYDRITN